MKADSKNRFSRRDLVVTGSAAVLSLAPLSRAIAKTFHHDDQSENLVSANQQHDADNSLENLKITHPTDSGFSSLLQQHFPEVMKLPEFPNLRPFVALVTNNNPDALKVFHIEWINVPFSSKGRKDNYFYIKPSQRLVHRTSSGKRMVLRGGATALICPFFILGVHRYLFLTRNARLEGFVEARLHHRISRYYEIIENGQVLPYARVVGLITKKNLVITDGRSQIAKHYRIVRNAEHDEAYSLHRLLREGGTYDQLHTVLQEHRKRSLGDSSGEKQLYFRKRRDFASRLLRHYNRESQDSTTKLISKVKRSKKVVLKNG